MSVQPLTALSLRSRAHACGRPAILITPRAKYVNQKDITVKALTSLEYSHVTVRHLSSAMRIPGPLKNEWNFSRILAMVYKARVDHELDHR